MKRCSAGLLLLSMLWGLCPLFAGCGAADSSLLKELRDLSSVTLVSETRTWKLTVAEDGTYIAEITAPPAAAGVAFVLSPQSSYACVGAVKIPVGDSVTAPLRPLFAIFLLSESQMTAIETDEKDGIRARFVTEAGEVAVYIGADGTPQLFETAAETWTVKEVTHKSGAAQ